MKFRGKVKLSEHFILSPKMRKKRFSALNSEKFPVALGYGDPESC